MADQGQEEAGSVPAREVDRKRESAHQYETGGPSRIVILVKLTLVTKLRSICYLLFGFALLPFECGGHLTKRFA